MINGWRVSISDGGSLTGPGYSLGHEATIRTLWQGADRPDFVQGSTLRLEYGWMLVIFFNGRSIERIIRQLHCNTLLIV